MWKRQDCLTTYILVWTTFESTSHESHKHPQESTIAFMQNHFGAISNICMRVVYFKKKGVFEAVGCNWHLQLAILRATPTGKSDMHTCFFLLGTMTRVMNSTNSCKGKTKGVEISTIFFLPPWQRREQHTIESFMPHDRVFVATWWGVYEEINKYANLHHF